MVCRLDKADGLKLGRREINNRLYAQKLDPWWCATIAVEYEKHHDVRKKDGLYEGYFVCATKTIAAPPADVFKAWSSGDELNKWFGSGTKADLKDGGSFQNKDGDKGTFLRVRENKDIRMTFEGQNLSAPTQVDVQFQDKGKGKTGLLVNHTQDSNPGRGRRPTRSLGRSTRQAKSRLRKLKSKVQIVQCPMSSLGGELFMSHSLNGYQECIDSDWTLDFGHWTLDLALRLRPVFHVCNSRSFCAIISLTHEPRNFSSGSSALVYENLSLGYRAAGSKPGRQSKQQRNTLIAAPPVQVKLWRFSCGHRRPGAARCRGKTRRHDSRRLRFASKSTQQRHSAQPASSRSRAFRKNSRRWVCPK